MNQTPAQKEEWREAAEKLMTTFPQHPRHDDVGYLIWIFYKKLPFAWALPLYVLFLGPVIAFAYSTVTGDAEQSSTEERARQGWPPQSVSFTHAFSGDGLFFTEENAWTKPLFDQMNETCDRSADVQDAKRCQAYEAVTRPLTAATEAGSIRFSVTPNYDFDVLPFLVRPYGETMSFRPLDAVRRKERQVEIGVPAAEPGDRLLFVGTVRCLPTNRGELPPLAELFQLQVLK